MRKKEIKNVGKSGKDKNIPYFPLSDFQVIFGEKARQEFLKSLEEGFIKHNPWAKAAMLENEKSYKIETDSYEEDKPGIGGEPFKITLTDNWSEINKKQFNDLIDILTMNAINKEVLKKEWEEWKERNYTSDKSINKYPLTPEESIRSCGERYEREND